jgi:hypothetical protein
MFPRGVTNIPVRADLSYFMTLIPITFIIPDSLAGQIERLVRRSAQSFEIYINIKHVALVLSLRRGKTGVPTLAGVSPILDEKIALTEFLIFDIIDET